MPQAAEAPGELISDLAERVGERLSQSPVELEGHSRDESHHQPSAPWAVVRCQSVEDVQAVLEVCRRHLCPVVPFGAGSGLEGGAIPTRGGVSLDLSGMNRVLRVGPEDLDATVEAGVTLSQLNSELGPMGLFFPVDPGSDPTLGGMVATRASGTMAVRYGTMSSNVLGLKVVLASGEVVATGGRARKSSAGYDLTHLFTGSEGTLGVIVEITLRVQPLPETVAAAVCPLPDLRSAVTAVIEVIQLGVPVARIELLDEVMVDAINRYQGMESPVTPTLMLEFQGAKEAVQEQIREVAQVVEAKGGRLERKATPEERSRLWETRHHALYAAKALRPHARTWSTDVCVPVSRLADCLLETKAELDRSRVLAPIVGHVGDGNFHLSFVLEEGRPEQVEEASALHSRMVERALRMGGTCTGEHGVGIGKAPFLLQEHPTGLRLMRQLKATLDPLGILNPGKVLEVEE
ncbi:MAG: FAD-binding oxidoreductase [Candidatus Dormibacteria bacterium]